MKEELNLFKALSDETRLRITVLLSKKELCVCQIQWVLGFSQAMVSRHLTVLKNAGIVQDRRKGLWIFYSLSQPRNELEKSIHKYLREYFTKRYDLFRKDLASMKKCLAQPLEKLCSGK